MTTQFAISDEEGIITIGAANGDDDYILWQKGLDESEKIHFTYQDQINSEYNIVTECSIDNDGCHIVLKSGEVVHFYWNPPRHVGLDKFIEYLRGLYSEKEGVIYDLR
jgi:hypothetical protein